MHAHTHTHATSTRARANPPADTQAPMRGLAVRRPELLAPAGDWECVRAAVENGADAVYFGLERFNARMRAKNFTQADLPALMEFLRARGVRGYVTFNTLVFANELGEAREFARAIIAAGADAAIVQDAGVCRIIREISPDFPIHASTQMTVTSAAGVEFARELGASLVVLARENTLADIEAIQAAQKTAHAVAAAAAAASATGKPPLPLPLPLEVFVHGALCVAYSGQCLTSEALGGRSANRGECAQACRLPYELICDGRKIDLGGRHYLLSPQDLAGISVLPQLVRAGVASLKIEGRLKSPEYVASITRVYRKALDDLNAECGLRNAELKTGQTTQAAPSPPASAIPHSAIRNPHSETRIPHSSYELEMTFSRGLGTGWFRGIDNQRLVHARFGTKRGVFLGEIARVDARNETVTLRLAAPLKPGDGVVFDAGTPEIREEGGRVYQADIRSPANDPHAREATLHFGRDDIDFTRIHPGNRLWKTNDPALDRELRATYEGEKIRFTRPIDMEAHGHAGAPLTLILDDREGHIARADSSVALAPAQTQPLTEARLREQLGRLGGTPFKLGALVSRLEGGVMLPMSELNRVRREAVEKLAALRAAPRRWTMRGGTTRRSTGFQPVGLENEGSITLPSEETERRFRRNRPTDTGWKPVLLQAVPLRDAPPQPEIIPVVRSLAQLDAALSVPGLATFYCEFENPKHYREAVARFRRWQQTGAIENPESKIENFPSTAATTTTSSSSIWVAPPRIFKPGEEWILEQVRSSNADGYLARNHEHLRFFAAAGDRMRGDFSLNVANQLAAEWFVSRYGLERVTASYDLNFAQLEALLGAPDDGSASDSDVAQAAEPARILRPACLRTNNGQARRPALRADSYDITIHQHMPMFHMEHCVFCAFLTDGKDYRDCGRPCEKHVVRLRDRVGAEFPLRADAGCRNTVFNNRAQTGAEYVARLLALGARHFRVEFLNEGADEVARTLARYAQLLRGEIDGATLWRELKLLNQLGVTGVSRVTGVRGVTGVTRGQMETAPRVLQRKGWGKG